MEGAIRTHLAREAAQPEKESPDAGSRGTAGRGRGGTKKGVAQALGRECANGEASQGMMVGVPELYLFTCSVGKNPSQWSFSSGSVGDEWEGRLMIGLSRTHFQRGEVIESQGRE